MPTPFWRSESVQDRLNRLDRPGFAFEFLRRNPNYRSDWSQTRHRVAQGTLDAHDAQAELARRWGLCFCP
ncbi:MAG: hypothetical protein FD119_1964 [Stygiobacter sp.]|nr:MAG: hypothetical protein FD119_1964 [Stygiobacter sp.]